MHKRDRTARRHARHSARVLNMKYTLEFVFIERWRDAVLSTNKMVAQHTLTDAVLST